MNILFLCTGNSCRSQMAEALARHHLDSGYNFYSAGTKTHGINPRAQKVIEEMGLSFQGHSSKTLEDITANFDLIVTVCGDAEENCPYVAGAKMHHHGFDDPPRLTKDMLDEEEILSVYRRVRDEIEKFVKTIPKLYPLP